MLKPLESDRVRKVLEPYLSDLDIVRDDVGGCTVKPFRNVDDDKSFLQWYKIDRAIRKLHGSWVKPTRFTKGHWRIP